MSWFDSVGKMAKSFADFTGIPGLIHDVANSTHNTDPWYSDAINVVKDLGTVATIPLRGAVKGALMVGNESYKLGGAARQWIDKGILDTPLMYNKFKNDGETFDEYRQRVQQNVGQGQISLGETLASVFSPGKNAPADSGWLADTLDKNLKFLSPGFDLFNEQDRQTAFHNQWGGKILSGITDMGASTIIDPLTFTGFIGKGAVIASKGIMLDDVSGKLSRSLFGRFAMDNEKVSGLLDQALKGEGRAVKEIDFLANSNRAEQYQYWVDKKVTNPDAMAYLFGEAKTRPEVVATYRAIIGKDPQAMAQLAENNIKTMLPLDTFNEIPHPAREFLNKATDGDILTSEQYHRAMSDYIGEMVQGNDRFAESLNLASSGRQIKQGFTAGFVPERFTSIGVAKRFAKDTFEEPVIETFRQTALHPPVKVINFLTKEVPSGIFDVNEGNSYHHFNVFLREVNQLSNGKFAAEAADYADKYLGAVTAGERMKLIANAEKSAMSAVFGDEFTQAEVQKIHAIYDSRRARAIA
jgi:hypothetical protein